MYDEMEEEEMNLSYNSLPECLNLKISEQLISYQNEQLSWITLDEMIEEICASYDKY